MAVLPIPQVDVPATERSDPEPGVGPVPVHAVPLRPSKNPLRTPVYPRKQNERGISHAMDHSSEEGTPNVPIAVRSSLAQTRSVFRIQLSRYISWIKPGPVPMTYPVAHVHTLINTRPKNRGLVTGLRGYPAQSSQMGAPPRFTKALKVKQNTYRTPLYGG